MWTALTRYTHTGISVCVIIVTWVFMVCPEYTHLHLGRMWKHYKNVHKSATASNL